MSDIAHAYLGSASGNVFEIARRGPTELWVRGELDLRTAPALLVALEEAGKELQTLDLGELTFLDSTGIHALIGYARQRDGGGPLRLANVPGWTLRVFEITGISDSSLFEIHKIDGD